MAAAIDHSGPEPWVLVSVILDRALKRAIDIALAGPVLVIAGSVIAVELPQLCDVLRRRMSLVGPPRAPKRVIDLTFIAARYSTRVGVTFA